eukprot:1247805-Rhodomonas_salina.1
MPLGANKGHLQRRRQDRDPPVPWSEYSSRFVFRPTTGRPAMPMSAISSGCIFMAMSGEGAGVGSLLVAE